MLMGFYQRKGATTGGDFDHGIEMALRRILVDPEFYFRKELEPANVKPRQKLPHQRSGAGLAPVLLPVEQHPGRRVAESGQPEQAARTGRAGAQVKRMLADPEVRINWSTTSPGNGSSLRALQTQVPVTAEFPDFDDNLRQAMRKEMEMFVGQHRPRRPPRHRSAGRQLHLRE